MRYARLYCSFIATFAFFMGGCPQAPGGGGVNGPDRPGQAVPGFFAAGESWALGSSTFFAIGTGNFVELMVVTSDEAGADPCIISDPDALVSFEEGQLVIQTDNERSPQGQTCRMDIGFQAAQCAPDEAAQNTASCELPEGEGVIEFDGQAIEAGPPLLFRFAPCEEDIPPLAQIEQWNLLSVHPLAISLTSDPRFLGGALVGSGNGQSLGAFLLATSTSGDEAVICLDETTSGSVGLNGDRLSVDVDVESDDNQEGEGTPGITCTAQFTGTVSSCTLFDPAALGGNGDVIQLVRFDGSGQIDTGGATFPLSTLYFGFVGPQEGDPERSDDAPPGDVDPPGGIRF